MSDNGFQPKILVFCCNWCSYAGADLAGVTRLQINPNFRIIRTMCSARVDPQFILEAFQGGVDGVLITGCHPGDCHYVKGNYKTRRRYVLLKKLLEQMGINSERFQLEWISAAESKRFQEILSGFIQKIHGLGKLEITS